MTRYEPLAPEQFTPEQKALHDAVLGSRKKLGGPFSVLLRNPALAESVNNAVRAVRQDGKLDKRLYELIVLIVARHWSASYVWAVHEPLARGAGLPDNTIDAIRGRSQPAFSKADEKAVYEAVTALLDDKKLSDAAYQGLVREFGLDQTIEIVATTGLYCMIATVINGFEVPTPNGERPF